jgi:hypothetical protein
MDHRRSFHRVGAAAATLAGFTFSLQGCASGGGGGPSPTPCPTTPGGPVPGWNLPPIVVRGQHLYFSNDTAKQFHVQGVGFPNVGVDKSVDEWIAVLQRIKKLAGDVNAIRIYEPPSCSLEYGSTCFEPFMREADRLGVYVLAPGSGTSWGYFPGLPSGCDPPISEGPGGLQGCYAHGGVLGFGRTIIENFNYPNTLAIVLANEIEQLPEVLPVVKAYARDLKIFMTLCNSNSESPSKCAMRQIPLMYAATDTGASFVDEADYLFCGGKDVSIDIYGLNVERWIKDAEGKKEYDEINEKVKNKQWPGAFLHSEEGGPYGGDFPARTWNQLPGFFTNWPAINGFFGYAYYGKEGFNMFDGPSATSTELPDGVTFFAKLKDVGGYPPNAAAEAGITPECATSIDLHPPKSTAALSSYTDVKIYDTGRNSWAKNCPKQPSPSDKASLSFF